MASTRGRGKVSHLEKAQSQAKKDVMEGKKISINRALMEVNAHRKGRR